MVGPLVTAVPRCQFPCPQPAIIECDDMAANCLAKQTWHRISNLPVLIVYGPNEFVFFRESLDRGILLHR